MANHTTSLTAEERQELLDLADLCWGSLQRVAAVFSDEELDREDTIPAEGGFHEEWSARDVMVHVANWEEATIRLLRDLEAGREPTADDSVVLAVDRALELRAALAAHQKRSLDWNEAQVARFHDLPLADAKRYVDETHAELLELVRRSPHIQSAWIGRLYSGHVDSLLNYRRKLLT